VSIAVSLVDARSMRDPSSDLRELLGLSYTHDLSYRCNATTRNISAMDPSTTMTQSVLLQESCQYPVQTLVFNPIQRYMVWVSRYESMAGQSRAKRSDVGTSRSADPEMLADARGISSSQNKMLSEVRGQTSRFRDVEESLSSLASGPARQRKLRLRTLTREKAYAVR
jgi:hypothetical protein